MELKYAALLLFLSSLATGCSFSSYDENLTFRRVCWGDGICKVEELEDGKVIATYGPNYGQAYGCRDQ